MVFVVKAQNLSVHGWVEDSLGNPLAMATVTLYHGYADTAGIKKVTSTSGEFTFSNLESTKYTLEVSFVGFSRCFREIELSNKHMDLGVIVLSSQVSTISEVKIVAKQAVKMKDDTLQYNANAFKTNPDATAEDLVKKMPGITIENGTVKAQGEEVKKVTVDGKTYFGDDANIALKNLSADMIEKVEVFDQWSDQAMFTGFDDGQSSKSMNIVTKQKFKQGIMGRVYAGYGVDNRYQAGGNFNYFKGERRISLLALSNNINQQNFSSEDISAATGSSVQQGMGKRNSSNPFLTGMQSGITSVNSFGLNYSDVWGKKVKVNGSYFFNQSSNSNTQTLLRTYYSNDTNTLYYSENGLYSTINFNHRINFKFDYAIDSLNVLTITPLMSFQNNSINNSIDGNNKQLSTLLNSSSNDYLADISAYRISTDVLYRHRFVKRGRTFSTNLRGEWNNKNQNNTLNAINKYFADISSDTLNQNSIQHSPNESYSANIIYTEPIGKAAQLMLNVKEVYAHNISEVATNLYNPLIQSYSVLDTTLSSSLQNNYFTHQGGLAFRVHPKRTVNIMLGADYQRVDMSNEQVLPVNVNIARTFENILPNAMLKAKLSSKSNVRINYRTNVNLPSVTQLQEVWNNSNPLLLSIGNTLLKSQYVQSLNVKWMYTDAPKSRTMMLFAMGSKTSNYIANATQVVSADTTMFDGRLLKAGTRYTRPLNLGSLYSVRSFFMWGIPIKKIKSNMNITGGYTYSLAPAMIDGKRGSTSSSAYITGFTLSSNISEKIDFTLSSNANYNVITNSLQSAANNNYFNVLSAVKFNYIFWKGVVLQTELTHTLYNGLNSFNRSFFLWNVAVGKKLFKDQNGDIRVSVFDALHQNNSVSRTVNEYYVDDLQNVVLQRYYMLTFTYKFKKIKTSESETVK